MMYSVRKGVSRVQICGVFFLISNREASEFCPSIKKVNLLISAALEIIEKGDPVENIYKAYSILAKVDIDKAKVKIDKMLNDLYIQGYLVKGSDI